MFKLFPGTFTSDGRKVPIKEAAGWKDISTTDQATLDNWSNLYGHKIKFWGIPTGKDNGILVLDVDVKDNGPETIKKYHVPLTMSQRTKSGGTHYIFKYPIDSNNYGNRTKFDVGLDIRGEGGYIAHYGLDHTPIAEAPDWLLKEALNIKKEVDLSQVASVAPEIAKQILEEAYDNVLNASPGESNNVLNVESYKLGQLVTSNNINKDEAFNYLFEAAKLRGKPDYEAKATINSGLQGGGAKPLTSPFPNTPPTLHIPEIDTPVNTRWTPNFFTKYDLTNISKLRKPQVFKDWSTEDIHITTADGGTGKTTLLLFESICLALGEDFLCFKCRDEGRTLFITGEDTREKIGAMIGVILKQMKILDDPIKVGKVLNAIVVKKESDLCIITKSKFSGFITPNIEAFKTVMEAVEDLRPKKIVFDPISSFWGSESALNDMSKAVAKFMGMLVEKSNACVEVINHMGKASSKDKDMTQFAGRGGTGLPSHARVSRVLRPVFDEEYKKLTGMELDDKGAMLCNVNKFSDGSPLYNKPFLIVRDGYIFSRVTLVEQKVKEEQNKMDDNERIFTFIVDERAKKRYPTKSIITANFMLGGSKMSKDRVKTALDVLVYAGHMGEKLKLIENPDPEVKDRVYVITDKDGRER